MYLLPSSVTCLSLPAMIFLLFYFLTFPFVVFCCKSWRETIPPTGVAGGTIEKPKVDLEARLRSMNA